MIDAIVSTLAGMLSSLIVAVVCAPIIWAGTLGLRREDSFGFWVRAVVIGQIFFWVGLLLEASASPYGLIKSFGDFVGVVFNFLLATPATALLIRTTMRYKNSSRSSASWVDPAGRLDTAFNVGVKAKSVVLKAIKYFRY